MYMRQNVFSKKKCKAETFFSTIGKNLTTPLHRKKLGERMSKKI